ncbi:MAG: nucleotidyltransferase [Lachnospiraceae bacterium]|nr:nucleotidyltransferase [Lachnospiraceae bacterium]
MKHIGIIAEYNPFHNGHQYQIQKAKELFPDKKIVVIMSGDFVQRGEPAIFNKYLRAKCALSSGADIILELPPLFSTASAEHFSSSAILALAATGVVDTLCFGAEYDNLDTLYKIADFLVTEPEDYQILLKQHLKSGLSFPKARSLALCTCLQDDFCETILKQPNNILGIEYLKAILKYHLPITPCIIKRQGSGYHDLSLENSLCSASSLRNKIKQHWDSAPSFAVKGATFQISLLSQIDNYIPASAGLALTSSEYAKPLFLSDFYPFLQYAFWQNRNQLDTYFEMPKELARQLSSCLQYPCDIEVLLNKLSCKNYTTSRIKRALTNILLNQKNSDIQKAKQENYITYLRLLGFTASSSPVLKEMKNTCTIPVINKVTDSKKILSGDACSRFEKDILISTLYKQAFFNKYGIGTPSEYEQSVIIEDL